MKTNRYRVLCLSLLFLTIGAAAITGAADRPFKPLTERAVLPIRFAPAFGAIGKADFMPVSPDRDRSQPMDLRAGTSRTSNPMIMDSTSYDYQHNCTMARQIEHRAGYTSSPYGGYLHTDWNALRTDGEDEFNPLGIGYRAFSLSMCSTQPVVQMNEFRAGYCGIDAHYAAADPDSGWAVGYAHENPDNLAGYAYWDTDFLGPANGLFFPDYPADRFGYWSNPGTGPDNENIWPKASWDIDGSEYVLHMVCTEGGSPEANPAGPMTCSYYRRVGPYGAGEGAWSDQRVIDTVTTPNVTVVSSPISNKVAVVWAAPVDWIRDQGPETEFESQYRNDVWFAVATDNGESWANNPTNTGNPSVGNTVDLGIGSGYNIYTGGNLTTYNDSMGDYRAYCDLSALWSIKDAPDDWLQIVWGCRRWSDRDSLHRRNGAIFHWNQKTDHIRNVAYADWDSGGACIGHAFGADVGKMTIAECDGRLYCTFTQFGFWDEPCGVYDTTMGPNGHVIAGQLYTSCYDEYYDAWDKPEVTIPGDSLYHSSDISQPTCTPDIYDFDVGMAIQDGDCSSEYWSSMARYGRLDSCAYGSQPLLDIIYINDQVPGGCVQNESGVWVMNPVNWYVAECRPPNHELDFAVYPDRFGICFGAPIIALGTHDTTTVVMTMVNNSILDNTPVSVTPTYVSGGIGATTVSASPNSGITIPGRGGEAPVTLTITTMGEQDFTTVYYDIEIVHQAGQTPPTTVIVPMCITVADDYIVVERDTLTTPCTRLQIHNNGQMSNEANNASLDFTDDPDDCADLYLYDGSNIICREPVLPGDDSAMCWFSIYSQVYGSERAIVQATPLFVDAASNSDYEYATYETITADSSIGMITEYFAPKNADDCGYMIIKQWIFNRTEITLTGVAWGDVLDWDIPGYEINGDGPVIDNFPWLDASRYMIWQTTAGGVVSLADPCDTLTDAHRYGAIAAAQNVGTMQDINGFKNYMVLENDQYVWQAGPEASPGNPFTPSIMYGLMVNTDGYYFSQDPPADTGEDLSTVVTFGVVDLLPSDTLCAVKIVTTSKNDLGAAILKNNVDRANAFILAHDEIKCELFPCDCDPGDPNDDGSTNVGDAVYLIDFIFRGGQAPTPYAVCSGDANADCAVGVGDAVFLINFVFKEGPPPATCEEWRANCGWPPQGE